MSSNYHIYAIINQVNGKIYIGKTNNLKHRWSVHKHRCKKDKYDYHLYQSIRKYGLDSFTIKKLYSTSSESKAYELEKLLIRELDTFHGRGLNSSVGGINNGSGKEAPNYGKSFTEEHKRKISESHKGKNLSKEHKDKISETKKGFEHTEETKRKISESHQGKRFSEKRRKNISKSLTGENNYWYGKERSNSNKEKLSTINKALAAKIKFKYLYSDYYQYEISSKFNVSQPTVSNIVNGKTWSHLPKDKEELKKFFN